MKHNYTKICTRIVFGGAKLIEEEGNYWAKVEFFFAITLMTKSKDVSCDENWFYFVKSAMVPA